MRHARNRMRLYEVAHEAVESAIRQPESLLEGTCGAWHAWKRMAPERWLRVTFKDEGQRRVIITVTPKRHPPKGGSDAH